MSKFHRDRVVEWDLHVSPDLGAYDIIIGRDILSDLEFKFDFGEMSMEWDGMTIPMKDDRIVREHAFFIQDPASIHEATAHLKDILDTKYEMADLQSIADSASHLSEEERFMLYQLLVSYEDVFDGSLGKWNMGTYDIELQPDAKPYHARAYPIPKVHTETLRV